MEYALRAHSHSNILSWAPLGLTIISYAMLLRFTRATPFGGQSLETVLRLLAFSICDLINIPPYV